MSSTAALFAELEYYLLGEQPAETHAQSGFRLGLSETAEKATVHRLRQRYRELLRQEVAHAVTRPEEFGAEWRYLWQLRQADGSSKVPRTPEEGRGRLLSSCQGRLGRYCLPA